MIWVLGEYRYDGVGYIEGLFSFLQGSCLGIDFLCLRCGRVFGFCFGLFSYVFQLGLELFIFEIKGFWVQGL